MDLSIIILNYRQQRLVRQCLRGILMAEPRCRYEVIVVDNDSGDGCLEMVAKQFPWVMCIANSRNCGFGAGNNRAIAQARGDYVFIVNPDITLFLGQIDELVDFLRSHPRVGAAGPRLVNPDGSAQDSCRRFPRFITPLYRRTWVGRLPFARRQLENFLMRDFNHRETIPVDWLMGACLMVRRQTFEEVGFFDEHFFLYYEDLDFCRRCWAAGWEVWYVATATPVHYHQRLSAGSGGVSAFFHRAAWSHIRSALQYYRKYRRQRLPGGSPSGKMLS